MPDGNDIRRGNEANTGVKGGRQGISGAAEVVIIKMRIMATSPKDVPSIDTDDVQMTDNYKNGRIKATARKNTTGHNMTAGDTRTNAIDSCNAGNARKKKSEQKKLTRTLISVTPRRLIMLRRGMVMMNDDANGVVGGGDIDGDGDDGEDDDGCADDDVDDGSD